MMSITFSIYNREQIFINCETGSTQQTIKVLFCKIAAEIKPATTFTVYLD